MVQRYYPNGGVYQVNGLWILGRRSKTINICSLFYVQMFKRFYWKFPTLIPRPNMPLHVDLELTNRCNLSCPHCSRQKNRRPIGDMSAVLFKKLVREIDHNSYCHLHLCGLGEPGMHPDIRVLLDDLHPKHIKVSITTNGHIFDRFEPEIILNWNIDLVSVSVDGFDADSYRLHRPGGDYKKLIANVRRFYEIRTRLKKTYPRLRIANVLFPNSTLPGDIGRFRAYWQQYSDMVAFTTLRPLERKMYDSLSQCSETFFGINVRWDGRVPACGYNPNEWIGDANQSSIREIFTSESRRELQARHLRKEYDKMEFCKSCFFAQDRERFALSHQHSANKNKILTVSNLFYRKRKIGKR